MVLPNLGRSVMSVLRFNRAEIEGLAQKLASPQVGLAEHERLLLLAIFAAARNRVRSIEDSGEVGITLTDLREQLLNAFIPDDGIEFLICGSGITPIGDPE
jgi:hypothetical protein